jgi:glycosyltransferase involved in cell wall biosynthesis
MIRILVLVFNDIKTDSRVIRTANTLAECDGVEVEVIGFGDNIAAAQYKSVVLNTKYSGGIKRYFAFLRALNKYLKDNHFDYLYANDFYSAIPVLRYRKKFKKIIYDAHELYIPNALSKMGLKSYFFYRLEKAALKRADGIICAQHDRAVIMEAHYKLRMTPTVIQNISKLDECNKELPDHLANELNAFFKKNETTIVYAGKIRPDSKIEEMMELLESNGKPYNVLIVGGGENLDIIKQNTLRYKNINVFFTGSLAFEMMGTILRRCSIAYMYYPISDLNNKYCAPNKLFEYSSIGLPTVCNENPTIKEIYRNWEIGVCNNDIIRAIDECSKNNAYYKQNCYKFNEVFSWDKEKKKLREYCMEVFNEKNS